MLKKECTKLIPRIYQYNAENQMLFAWVNAQKKLVPTVTIRQAVQSYIIFFDLDSWDIESAVVTFGKISKEYYNENTKENK